MIQEKLNCIGFVAHQLGLDPEERFRPCPNLEQALTIYDEVPDARSASAVGIVFDKRVVHLAIVEEGGNVVSHRKGYVFQ